MKTDQQIPVQHYVEIAWRRKWWVVVPVLVSLGASIGLLAYLPRTYLSSTTILVEPQKVPEDYVKPAVSGTIEDRLTTIRQQILSRSLLQRIIDEFGLYREETGHMANEDLISFMRNRIDIRTVGNNKNVDAFTISYEGESPVVVMKVTSKLASLFIEENLKIREQLVEGTSDFLENELKSVRESLNKQEQEISGYKKGYMGELPQQLDANLRTLDRYQMEFQTVTGALKVAEERKTNLEKILSEESRAQAEVISPLPHPERVARLKQELEQLRAEYKESYPDIITLKREISDLEESLYRKPVEADEVRPPFAQRNAKEPTMPLDGVGFYRDLQKQLKETSIEARSLQDRYRVVLKQIQLYEKRVENTPQREQQLMTLLRDYENTKKNYQALLDKKLNARISENLEKRQKGEQFRILDPANLPERTFKPDRTRVLGLGVASGVGVGLALALLIELLDTSFKRPEEVEEALRIPVLVSVPRFPRKRVRVKVEVLRPPKPANQLSRRAIRR